MLVTGHQTARALPSTLSSCQLSGYLLLTGLAAVLLGCTSAAPSSVGGAAGSPAIPGASGGSAGGNPSVGGNFTVGGGPSGNSPTSGAGPDLVGGTGGGGGGPPGSAGAGGGETAGGGTGPGPVSADAGCTVYASPAGSGAQCTAQAPCSLPGARDRVRQLNAAMTADIEVCLAGGTYALSEPFVLTENATTHDSGSNGFNVIYRPIAGQKPLVSGGKTIAGFVVQDAALGIYRAPAPGLTSRQVFVNGQRATRARSKDNYGMKLAGHGFTANTPALASFKNPTHIELVGELDWRHYRCPVESISGNDVRLQSPCWELSQDINGGWWNFKEVGWVENAYELLDEAGEFYLDEGQGQLFYKPRPGEDMATASVVVPVLETLVSGKGSPGQPLRNIAFRGITFAHATWHEPSTSVGYTSWQSGFLHRTLKQYYDSGFYVMPSNLVFEMVDSLRFEDNVFTHLGASGIDLFHASSNNSLIGNRFEDISGRGITLGHIDDYAVPPAEVLKNNTIKNNAIFNVGDEYRDCAMVFVGYTQKTVIEHNWLRFGPYIGISLGWGWASHPESTAGENLIRFNRIEDFMQHTFDGSGVYALGVQRNSSVDHNYIYRGLPRGEGIFPDQGAAYMAFENNVIEDVGWQWIHDWSSQAHHNTIRGNITNQPNFEHSGGADKNDVFENNIIVTDGKWPDAVKDIKAKAGLEPAFAHVAQ